MENVLLHLRQTAKHMANAAENLGKGITQFASGASSTVILQPPTRESFENTFQGIRDFMYIHENPKELISELSSVIRELDIAYNKCFKYFPIPTTEQQQENPELLSTLHYYQDVYQWLITTGLPDLRDEFEGNKSQSSPSHPRLKWNINARAFAYIYGQMAENNYFEAPRHANDEINYSELATILLNIFDIGSSHEYLSQNLNPANNGLSQEKVLLFPDFKLIKTKSEKTSSNK